ncbi:ImmA/IrrE family metallo-endopeptidase [Candidatus Saccharibacteria bacterium]|nr:ImmA/IrrE family metallo-endopeptidase [Candidatus Saccharibacteria bacterium]
MKFDLGDGRYREIEDRANAIILDLDSILPPYNLEKIAEKLGIKVIKLSSLPVEKRKPFGRYFLCEENDAFVAIDENCKKVIVDDITRPPARVYFTIAHEIGHVVLGHLEHSELAEFEANIFARCLVAPYGIIRNFSENEFDVEFLSERLGISAKAAMHCRGRSLARLWWHDDDIPESTQELSDRYLNIRKGVVCD